MNEIITMILVPIGRAAAGWFQNALADGKITWPEWRKLCITVLTLGVPAAALMYGFDLPIQISLAAPILVDYIYQWIKKIIKKNKEK